MNILWNHLTHKTIQKIYNIHCIVSVQWKLFLFNFIHWTSLRTAKLRMLTNVDTYIFWPLNILHTLTRLSFTPNHNSSQLLIYSPRGPRKPTGNSTITFIYAMPWNSLPPAGYVQNNDKISSVLFCPFSL